MSLRPNLAGSQFSFWSQGLKITWNSLLLVALLFLTSVSFTKYIQGEHNNSAERRPRKNVKQREVFFYGRLSRKKDLFGQKRDRSQAEDNKACLPYPMRIFLCFQIEKMGNAFLENMNGSAFKICDFFSLPSSWRWRVEAVLIEW